MNVNMKKSSSLLLFSLASFALTHAVIAHNSLAIEYEAIEKFLNQYKRPVTILEIDAHLGCFSLKIAKEYGAVCVMTEEKHSNELLKLCISHKNNSSLMLFDKKMDIDTVTRLAECEHFDIVLCMNGFDEYQEQWKEMIDAVLELGEHTFITAYRSNNLKLITPLQRKIYEYLKNKNGTILLAQHPTLHDEQQTALFLLSKPKTHLKRKYWTFKKAANDTEFAIDSTFFTKTFRKKKGNKTLPWHPGINLLTFKTLNGIFPVKETIRDKLNGFKHIKHTDLHIWNIIIQGDTLIPIDGDDRRMHYNPRFTLHFIMQQFKRLLAQQYGMSLNDTDLEG